MTRSSRSWAEGGGSGAGPAHHRGHNRPPCRSPTWPACQLDHWRRRRTTLTSTTLALLLLLGGVPSPAPPQGQASRHQGQDPPLRRPVSPFHLVDADGDGATSLGDYPAFHDILLRNGEEVRDEGGTCPIVDVEQGLIHCTGTIRLAEGQLAFQGLTTTAATKHIAITGGTAATRT
jgi:hypothetical protein